MRILSGVTDQYCYLVAVDATDLKTRETGFSSWTVYRSRNGAAAVAMTTPTINETDSSNMPGVYELLLDEDMTIEAGNDSEEMVFHITHAGMAPVTRVIELYRPKITAGYTLGVASDGDLVKVNTLNGHTPQTADNDTKLSTLITNVPGVTATKAQMDTAHALLTTPAQVASALGTYDSPTKAEMDTAHALLATPAQVNAQMVDALNVDTYSLPGQAAPPATPTIVQALTWQHKQLRNKEHTSATVYELFNDAGDTVDTKAGISDDGSDFVKEELVSGP